MRLAVLVSGTGTILEAILGAGIPVAVVMADRPCRALEIAAERGVVTELVERTDFSKSFDRDGYTEQLIQALKRHDVDLVVTAGFGTVAPAMAETFPAINTHPALLPAFKGWHPVRDALAAGVQVTGCTVHVLTREMDEGRILAQEAVRVEPGDTEQTLHERIKEVERHLLPDTVRRIMSGEIEL